MAQVNGKCCTLWQVFQFNVFYGCGFDGQWLRNACFKSESDGCLVDETSVESEKWKVITDVVQVRAFTKSEFMGWRKHTSSFIHSALSALLSGLSPPDSIVLIPPNVEYVISKWQVALCICNCILFYTELSFQGRDCLCLNSQAYSNWSVLNLTSLW